MNPKEQAIRQEIVILTERTRRTIQELGEMMLELVDITTAQRRELGARQDLLERAADKLDDYCTEANGDLNDSLAAEIYSNREHWQRHTL
jgi:hypothetical protein